ncbi:MAG: insulinase family protein, partial [Myxococcota bacterium]|nr:insulinase family protein [Myxococcota bacterium]
MRRSHPPHRTRELVATLCAAVLFGGCCPHQVKDTPVPLEAPPAVAAAPVEPVEPEPRSLRPEIRHETLDNGLEIYMLEDHAAPLVSFQVWFDVGARNEHEAREGEDHGITGLSHFFEHMMFRGTEKHPKFFDEIYALGGKLNAFTWLDETVYWENIPSQHLERVIAMESNRLEHMALDFLNLEPEREVVKSERLLRTENRPEGMAWE